MDEHGRDEPAASGMHVDSDESGQHRWPRGASKMLLPLGARSRLLQL